jgi:polar amino acid transport system substrate-binding protein
MRPTLLIPFAFLFASCAMTPDHSALRREFAPTGVLKVGINYGNPVIAQRDPAGGDPRGVGPELARELARRLGLGIRYFTYPSAGKMTEGLKADGWDLAFLAVDPKRAQEIAFSPPYVEIEGTYLVRADSPYRTMADIDRPGTRLAVATGSAYDLYLTRELKNVQFVRVLQVPEMMAEFHAGRADVLAGVRQALQAQVKPGLRVLDGSFMVIRQAAGVPQGRPNAARYLGEFITEMKASGFVRQALDASGNADAPVAK